MVQGKLIMVFVFEENDGLAEINQKKHNDYPKSEVY